MIDSQYIFPATLSALTILATVLNFTAHFSNGEYLSLESIQQNITCYPSLHDRVYFRLDDSLTGRDAIIASISRK
mgnify:CR=1 FL=1